MRPDFKEYINEWLLKAEHDLVAAQRLLEIAPMILDSACFHSQQAIEKSLKGFIGYSGKEIEKTHSITFLLSQCSIIDPIFKTIDPKEINAFAVCGRYPDFSISPDIEEANYYYQLAIEVYSIVKERIVF